MPRYFLELAYKGTAYCGWQIQQNAITVQQKLDESLSVLLRHPAETLGCGRTDTSVHASQFFAHFDTENSITDAEKFCYQLNSLLPFDISIYNLIPVADDAHARFDATSRSYRYFISTIKNPFLKDAAWYWRTTPDLALMNKAAAELLSFTDFSSFAKAGGQQLTNNCIITEAQWINNDGLLEFRITANRFLRGMVRSIVGTLLDAGQQKISIDEFREIIENKNRSDAGESVSPHGLYLSKINYPYINSVERKIFIS
ncbi:MAG: tRNA pseudouridine(38-40) synthase TruA [Bacteroidota bacterium]